MKWTRRWARRLRVLVNRGAVERELDEELAFHLEMETQKHLREGMSPEEARRRARVEFGGVEKFREEVREARALAWLTGLSLDFRLGARMLRRYPGLTLAAGVAMTFAIGAGAATFEVATQLLHPRLPLPEGDRVVGIQSWDTGTRRAQPRMAHDLARWREELRSVEELGAFRGVQRNLIIPGGSAEPVTGVEMSAAGFRVARVPPLLGRYLQESDERPGGPAVLVIDHELWQRRFGADPAVVGREVRLGSAIHTIVGVMPAGFGFPFAQRIWLPLRLTPAEVMPGAGPELKVFGRLATGASLADAQAELTVLGERTAAAAPETHRRVQPRVLPYARAALDIPWTAVTGATYATNAGVLMFVLLICANVATLVFARTASRETELVVRTALGASRRRIVLQLFAEALVLGGIAVVLGLGAAALGLRWGIAAFETVTGELPFWFGVGLSLRTVVYAGVLGILAGVVAGVVPALRMTGQGAEQRIRQAAVGGSSLRFGRLWTGIIVTQVALTAAFAPILAEVSFDTASIGSADIGFPASEYLSARLRPDEPTPGTTPEEASLRFQNSYRELEARLEAEPGVRGVTHAAQVPGAYHLRRTLEVEGVAVLPGSEAALRIQTARVAHDFFEVLGAPLLTGRGFHSADAAGGTAVVVNESFVSRVLAGRSAVGRRIRYLDETADGGRVAAPGPWHEIVGVVRDVALTVDPDLPHNAGIYHAGRPEAGASLAMMVHTRGDPADFAPRLRAVATASDPSLQLHEVRSAEASTRDILMTYRFWVRVAYLACAVVLLLSILGIHSVMSFTVARRTREIGIRVALGAGRAGIMRSIFARTFAQVAMGTGAGLLLVIALGGGIRSLRVLMLMVGGVLLMVAATAVAGFVPARRALRIPPMEAMRTEG